MKPELFLVLVVDDDPPIIDLLQHISREMFPQATFISRDSPQSSLDYLSDPENSQPHLILLDIDLHHAINGIELLPQIRELLKPKVPIIMFSVSENQQDVVRAYQAGAVAYTKKPDSLDGWKRYVELLKSFWYDTTLLPGDHLT